MANGKPEARSARSVYLVESIPTGMEDLIKTEGVRYTGQTLKRLVDEAETCIDITAMYWALTANPDRNDEKGFTVEELLSVYAADEGQALYDSLVAAAKRGVEIRIVQSPGFDSADDEGGELKKAAAGNVNVREINLNDWFNSGIMHQKIWIFDRKHVYLGSANNDWKSLTQVKEIGIGVENDPAVAEQMTRYFETWWEFCDLEPCVVEDVFDAEAGIRRPVPAWSCLLPPDERKPNPLDRPEFRSEYDWDEPMRFGEGSRMFLSGAPREVCVGRRTFDGDALINTILEAEDSVSICVMDFAPVSLYRGEWDAQKRMYMEGDQPASPVWWPALFNAVIHVVTTKKVHARIFVSEWAHTSPFVAPYLYALEATAAAAAANKKMKTGVLEVKRFVIPGWDQTSVPHVKDGEDAAERKRAYPGHTRVNHTKYIVTEKRINVGTSNMTWDYFAATAGASFNTDDPVLVAKLQEIFDRDWRSPYAAPLEWTPTLNEGSDSEKPNNLGGHRARD